MSTETPSCAALALQRYRLNGETMGTRYSAVFFAPPQFDASAVAAPLASTVAEVDRQMSTWKPTSDLNRLNAAPVQQWVHVPQELFTVLSTALQIGRHSGGAFDIGVGALVNAWGFGPPQRQPDAAQIRALKAQPHRAAMDVLELDGAGCRVRKRAALSLDLSGIAKGFGVDQMARCLDGFGVTRYLVGIDGEMRARGVKPDQRPWAIAIEKPLRGHREAMGVVELNDAAIATSGDYRHWFQVADTYYAHTMSPSLGRPVNHRLAAVTVVAPSCMQADAWATALLVLGEEAGVRLAQERGMDAVFVLRNGEGFEEIAVNAGQLEPPR